MKASFGKKRDGSGLYIGAHFHATGVESPQGGITLSEGFGNAFGAKVIRASHESLRPFFQVRFQLSRWKPSIEIFLKAAENQKRLWRTVWDPAPRRGSGEQPFCLFHEK